MLANIISQTVIDEVIGNSEDSLPNKIKEKEESLQNTLNNRLSIPILKIETDETTDEYTDVSASDVEPQVEMEDSSPNYSEDTNNEPYGNEFDLICFSDKNVFEGNEKPINVKEHMIINMMKKYSKLFVTEEQKFEQDVEESQVEDTYEENTNEESVDVESEAIQYGMPANIEKILVNTVDFDTTVVAINQTREKYKNVAEQANRAEHDAEESDKLLQKISDEYSEVEKQLREKELRSKAMEQKIISLLNNEQNRLSKQLQEKESVINNANKRKEENNGKIVDFKTKISSTLEKSNEYDAMLSRQEELLNTLIDFNTNFNENRVKSNEKVTGRVA